MEQKRVVALVRALRPTHWIKNVFVLAPMVFAQQLRDPVAVQRSLQAFGVFCALSSAVYLINDIADREADRRHPVKKSRPVAAGTLPVWLAGAVAAVLAGGGLVWALTLGGEFAAIAATYLIMNLAYSMALKRVVILDVMLVAAGFLLRAWAGAVVVDVAMSQWLILCTGLVALFLGFVKRRQEIAGARGSEATRPILREYSPPFLDQMIAVVTSSTVLAYALYAFDPEVAERLGTRHMGLTLPFVLFGIFRYLYLVYQRGEGDNPTALVISDVPLLLNVVAWAGAVIVALYVWR
ncbi:MAG: decaprenyl-phosphate phosphoribosyltransferase [Acidobacteriota bacterium]|nr:decaprenyl-phosphate phosphoribosyltransferase [Acidobacteriota bacterium]